MTRLLLALTLASFSVVAQPRTLGNVPPTLALYDFMQVFESNSEHGGYFSTRNAGGCEASNFNDIWLGEDLGDLATASHSVVWPLLSEPRWLQLALVISVLGIVLARSKVQMIRIDTCRIVSPWAVMKNPQTVRYLPSVDLPRIAWCDLIPVSSVAMRLWPYPNPTGLRFLNAFKEFFWRGSRLECQVSAANRAILTTGCRSKTSTILPCPAEGTGDGNLKWHLRTSDSRCFRARLLTAILARSIVALSTCSCITAQIICGLTPDSMASARAGSLAATELGKWRANCYLPANNPGPSSFTQEEFAIRFNKLHQLDQADVADIFNVKQSLTRWAKVARVCEVLGAAGLAATGIAGVRIGVQAAIGIGVMTYTATKAGEYATRNIPPTTNALSGMAGPGTITLQPGQGVNWKIYASKLKGASEMGPYIMGQPIQPKLNASAELASFLGSVALI